ncbi:hypothetical protein [Pseudomonas virus PBPA162]|uniref:Uncharacterized protein n=1 Tax=Pseudomonas virus PBPA162 TaxID=2588096 RepID=A0A4Y5TNH0_9CAUD|nr:hypothetical protein PQC32_gp74 [Pseudomonas virus PBPA162]QDB70908.1 hypothetical protein [Pseudomonas virus PBPA162]
MKLDFEFDATLYEPVDGSEEDQLDAKRTRVAKKAEGEHHSVPTTLNGGRGNRAIHYGDIGHPDELPQAHRQYVGAAPSEFRDTADYTVWYQATRFPPLYREKPKRIDPFEPDAIYKMMDAAQFSEHLGRHITTWEDGCRHALLQAAEYRQDDIDELGVMRRELLGIKEKKARDEELLQATNEWRDAVRERKEALALHDERVRLAREKMKALK